MKIKVVQTRIPPELREALEREVASIGPSGWKRWTELEIEILKEYGGKLPAARLKKFLPNRTIEAIQAKRNRLVKAQ